MRSINILLMALFYMPALQAQLTAEQRIQDSVIGWWDDNYWDRNFKPQTDPINKKRETYATAIVEWMKKSYTPVGGLGTVTRYVNNGGFGVNFMVWNVSHDKMWTDAKGHFKPISEENTKFYVTANKVYGTDNISFISSPNEKFLSVQPDGYGEQKKGADPRIHPNAYPFITWVNNFQIVYLAPGNKLPWKEVSKGEFLQKAEAGLENVWADEVKNVKSQWSDKKTQDDVLVRRKKTIEQYRSNIQLLRERHKNSLQEPAIIRTMQPNMYSFEPDPDIFDVSRTPQYQVYKMDSVTITKMKNEASPQWIAIAWPYQSKEDGNQLYELHTALAQNFNYEYVYNYFFDPGKVKGITYKPANEEQLNARLNAYRNKYKSAANSVNTNKPAVAGLHFGDDFSGNTEGSSPMNWFNKTTGKHSIVTSVPGLTGKWVQLGYNNPVSPIKMKKPLPSDFHLSFDVATDGEFSSRTGGSVRLVFNSRNAQTDGTETNGGNGTRMEINFISGNEADYNNNNYRGEIRVKVNSFPAVNVQNYSEGIYYTVPLRDFTNKKTSVRIQFTVKNGMITILANDKLLASSSNFTMLYGDPCKLCGISPGTVFNTLSWSNITDRPDETKVYISNVKIVKE